MSRNKLRAIFESGFEAVYRLVKKQSDEILSLKKRIKALEGRLNQNSSNSSRPPSTDWPVKKINLRKKTGRSPGGTKRAQGKQLKNG